MKVYVVLESGWSPSGTIVLWVCKNSNEVIRRAELRKDVRTVQEFELIE